MDTNFTGIRFDGQYSFYQHNNDNPSVGQRLLDMSATSSTARGFPYPQRQRRRRRRVRRHRVDRRRVRRQPRPCRRPTSATARSSRSSRAGATTAPACSRTSAADVAPGSNRDARCGGSATSADGNALFFTDAATTVRRPSARSARATITQGAQPIYNFAPLNYFQRPDERYIAGVFADYEITPAIKPYLEFMFMDDRTLAQIAPSGDFGNTLTINCDNPLLSARSSATSICNAGQPDQRLPRQLPARRWCAGYNPNPATLPPIDFFDPLTGDDLQPGLLPAASPQRRRRSAYQPTSSTPATAACSARAATSTTSGPTTPTSSTAGPTTRRSTRTSSRSPA